MPPERKLLPGKKGRSKLHAPLFGEPSTNDFRDVDQDDDDDDDDDSESDDVIITELISPEDQAVVNAKVELMKSCDGDGISLYHHLSDLLTACLTSSLQPDQASRSLEQLSRQIKRERVKSSNPVSDTRRKLYGETKAEWELFKIIGHEIPDANPKRPERPLLRRHKNRLPGGGGDKEGNASKDTNQSDTQGVREIDDDLSEEDRKLKLLPDLMKQCHMFNMAGFGLPVAEYTKLALAMRELVLAYPLKSIRFWGKILGTRGNYYVVETKLLDDDDDDVDDDDEDDNDDAINNDDNHNNKDDDVDSNLDEGSDDDSDLDIDFDPSPKTTYRPPPVIPKEEPGIGVNAFVYFVCSQPGLPWCRLPDVLPKHIVTARQVTSLFTGDLNHMHATYPPFPGDESCYLRAQVARITSNTCISPIGYYKFDEDAEEEEEEHADLTREACVVDDEFEGLSIRELCDPGLTNWAHHVNYILPQGRTTWFNPYDAPRGGGQGGEGEDEYDEEEEEERMDADEMEPEVPQPLLVPISEDVDVGPSPPWVARMTSQFVPEYSPVAITSVRWPGAVTVAADKGQSWANLYIGWGLKVLGDNFDPAVPVEPRSEFPTGPEVIEQEDPTPEEEAAMKAVMREQEELMMDREGDEEEEEEEEEEQEGEDEDEY